MKVYINNLILRHTRITCEFHKQTERILLALIVGRSCCVEHSVWSFVLVQTSLQTLR
jgi:hypothetical protein